VNANLKISVSESMDADTLPIRNFERIHRKAQRAEPRRRSQGGFHCRRNKHHTWGAGAAARLADLRAFAGAALVALFAIASSASADSFTDFTWNEVLDPGNAAADSGFGSVSYNFIMSSYETTNSQYAYFLNNSQTGRDNLYNVYNANMNPANAATSVYGSLNAGIVQTFNAGTGTYSYSVVAGMEDRPVNFVNWFSAARFVNWYANGATVSSSTETGSYTLVSGSTHITSGAIVARNANARVFLPSADEWTKAAYYDPTTASYKLYPTNNDSTPIATINTNPATTPNVNDPNAANYGQTFVANVSGVTTDVGLYTNTTSAYGAFDMLGNVTELTDTANSGGRYLPFGGSFASTSLTRWTSSYVPLDADYRLGANVNQNLGFRIAAVPEPGNMVAAALGIAGLIAVHLVKRRKPALARVAA